jgi:hypothetical protein
MSLDRTLRRPVRRRPVRRGPVRRPASGPLETVRPPAADRRPWLVLAPANAIELTQHSLRGTPGLAPGTPVVLVADGPLAQRHLRRAARRAGISVQRELIALPSTRSPLVVVDDEDQSIALFWQAVAMVPPGLTHAQGMATLVLRFLASASPALTRRLAPGRILIGHTT